MSGQRMRAGETGTDHRLLSEMDECLETEREGAVGVSVTMVEDNDLEDDGVAGDGETGQAQELGTHKLGRAEQVIGYSLGAVLLVACRLHLGPERLKFKFAVDWGKEDLEREDPGYDWGWDERNGTVLYGRVELRNENI